MFFIVNGLTLKQKNINFCEVGVRKKVFFYMRVNHFKLINHCQKVIFIQLVSLRL